MICRWIHTKRLLLITLLVLSHGLVYAEWVAIEKKYQTTDRQSVYIDPATIHRDGNLVLLWQLIDFQWMQGNPKGTPRFLSTKTHKQFNCAEKCLRLLAFTDFSRRMGTVIRNAGYVDKDRWLPVEPESLNHALWEVACGTQ